MSDNRPERFVTGVGNGRDHFVVTEAPEGGFTAKAIREAIFTEADDMRSLYERVRDAVRCQFDEDAAPRLVRRFGYDLANG